MVANTGALADRPQIVEKADARREIWHYLAYIANSQGKPTDTTKPVCKRCEGSQKHLVVKYPDLNKEFKERQEKSSVCERYREVCEELSAMKSRSEREAEALREHLRLALSALHEHDNSLRH